MKAKEVVINLEKIMKTLYMQEIKRKGDKHV